MVLKSSKLIRFWVITLILSVSEPVFAKNLPNIGEIAEKLIVGTDVITQIVLGICFVMACGMFIVGLIHFKAHRSNPKMIPLDRPIMYVVLGVVLLALPFLGELFIPTRSTIDLKEARQEKQCLHDIDAPLEFRTTPNP